MRLWNPEPKGSALHFRFTPYKAVKLLQVLHFRNAVSLSKHWEDKWTWLTFFFFAWAKDMRQCIEYTVIFIYWCYYWKVCKHWLQSFQKLCMRTQQQGSQCWNTRAFWDLVHDTLDITGKWVYQTEEWEKILQKLTVLKGRVMLPSLFTQCPGQRVQ